MVELVASLDASLTSDVLERVRLLAGVNNDSGLPILLVVDGVCGTDIMVS